MHFSTLISTSLSLASLCTVSQAWPLFLDQKRSPEPVPLPQSYSVVPVYGGASATQPVTNVQTQTQTLISTVTMEGSEQATTIVATQTVPVTITAENTAAQTATKTMVVEPSVTSAPYDNGQWHTTYYYRSTLSDVLIPASSPSGVSISTPAAAPLLTTLSAGSPTTTDWAKYYGSWHSTAVDGSWWGEGSSRS